MEVAIKRVLGVNALFHLLIFIGKLFSLLDHFLDLLLSEAALVVGDGDLLGLTSALVFGTDVQDTVGIDLKGNLDLWLSAGSRRDSSKFELAQQVVVLGHGTLTFEDLDVHSWLVVLVSGKDLRLLGWDDSVTANKLCHDTTNSL